MIDDFLAEAFEGLEPSPARARRWNAAPNLHDDPSPEQVDAWVEIAELVSDAGFRQRIRQRGSIGVKVSANEELHDWLGRAQESAEAAVLRGCPPDSAEAAGIADQILESAARNHLMSREELTADLEVLTDPRIERYWQLTATINGWPPFPSHISASTWLLAALRASQ